MILILNAEEWKIEKYCRKEFIMIRISRFLLLMCYALLFLLSLHVTNVT